ncbi:thioredoxin-like protein [Richelia intracellularis HH01]|jgi:thiol-disulfide isomerase/thioredoxin|uniref:Thioredoxin-like protein n=1 Tax=Richelia intracellularis HH01 TaxID=1165094 RepID=M1WSL2_9NOST|nr:thioredoxin family protein [Richelia intracellularis]CCH67524.1 thioredoxin-like protein [Richelia intracellularis HH01]
MNTKPHDHYTVKTDFNRGIRIRNFLIIMVAISLSASLFLGLKTNTSTTSLMELDSKSIPLEVAVSNMKPSIVEFYAGWCTVCQKMAPDIAEFKRKYGSNVNFVLLNVDNTKWLPEMLKYRVDGIPHFLFLDKKGETIGQSVGNQPHTIMERNLQALVKGDSLPYVKNNGDFSEFSTSVVPLNNQYDPRSHSSQIIK